VRAVGWVASPDGRLTVRKEVEGALEEGAALGERLGELVLKAGGRGILQGVRAGQESP
jgi:hypothetical protein